jgi:uncharacterized membrane protein YdbT with pleckstrin-like domain
MSEATSVPGDAVTYEARLHWILFSPPLAFFAGGLAAVFFNPFAAIAFLCISVIGIVGAYWKLATTRIVITQKRVIYRTGYVARRTVEMNKDKIESIDVNQSILGRLLDFGSICVKGTGGGIEAIPNVSAPFSLREHVAAMGGERSWLPGISEPAKL